MPHMMWIGSTHLAQRAAAPAPQNAATPFMKVHNRTKRMRAAAGICANTRKSINADEK